GLGSPESVVYNWFDRLIMQNPKLADKSVPVDVQFLKSLTRGQELLILYILFDREMMNGGIAQFFCNNPHHIIEFRHALLEIDPERSLLTNYDAALKALGDNNSRWAALKQAWTDAERNGAPLVSLFE